MAHSAGFEPTTLPSEAVLYPAELRVQRFGDAESVAIILTLPPTVPCPMHDVVDFERLFRGLGKGCINKEEVRAKTAPGALARGFNILLGCVQYFERPGWFGRCSSGPLNGGDASVSRLTLSQAQGCHALASAALSAKETVMQLKDASLFRPASLCRRRLDDADSGATVKVDNPATGETLGTIPKLGRAETKRAIDAANRACRPGGR